MEGEPVPDDAVDDDLPAPPPPRRQQEVAEGPRSGREDGGRQGMAIHSILTLMASPASSSGLL